MAKVIAAPSVLFDRRRSLPSGVGISSSKGAKNFPETDQQNLSELSNEIPSCEDNRQNERIEELKAEVNAGHARALFLEKQLADLKNDLEGERRKARELGYQEGIQKAREEIISEQAKEVEAIRVVCQSILQERTLLIEKAEEAAVEIGWAALIKVLGNVSTDRSLVVAMVKQALAQVSEQEGLVVHLAPEDYQWISQFRSAEENETSWGEVEFRANERIELGGCIVESRAGSLDARLEMQLHELKRLLVGVSAQIREK